MLIKKIESNELEKYESIASSMGCVFNSLKWINMYGSKLKLFGIYNDNKELVGSFFIYESSKLGMKYAITPPFTPHNGLFFENRAQNRSNQNTFEKNVMEDICSFFNRSGYKLIISAFPFNCKDTQPFFWSKYKVVPNYTYRVDLTVSEEELMNNLTSEKRKSLKKAEKDGLRIEKVTDYKIVKELILKTFSRKEKQLNTALLDKILFEFADDTNSYAYIAYNADKAIATTFCVHDKKTAYYLFGGYDSLNRHHGAGVSTMWNCMMHAKKMGLQVYDFEGSMLQEVEKYFREFGGELTPYYTINKGSLPVEMGLKFIKRSTF